ncbi:MAG TPA: hypothetical protein VF590_12920 [Isosphaeraceae bacterium]
MSTVTLEQLRDLSKALAPQDKLRLIDELVQQLLREPAPTAKTPFRSLYGALADLGPGPSAEDIDEMRREAWANFPREDF